ncbi:MAG TPA: bacteriophage holin [Kutzneria sp.]|nr:bacteriophage holin [Kutzneria sp.]
MLYVIAALVIVPGLVLLGVTLQRTLRKAARLKSTAARAQADIADRRGLIRARIAALGVALAQRRRIGSEHGVAGVAAEAEGRHR